MRQPLICTTTETEAEYESAGDSPPRVVGGRTEIDQAILALHHEIKPGALHAAIFKQALNLFRFAQAGLLLVLDNRVNQFKCEASLGYDLGRVSRLSYSYSTLCQNLDSSDQLKQGVFWLDGGPIFEGGLKPKSQTGLALSADGRLFGLLILDSNQSAKEIYSNHRLELRRFREHAELAFAKTRVIDDLLATQKELVENAHKAGMAEIATNVLHTVGNNLNSVKTSVHIIQEAVHEHKPLKVLEKIANLLNENRENLGEFLESKGWKDKLPNALLQIQKTLATQLGELKNESDRLFTQVQTMSGVLQEQQKYTHIKGNMLEPIDINRLIQDALQLESYLFQNMSLEVREDFAPLPLLFVEKTKFIRILVYLLKNAWEAIEARKDQTTGRIILRTRHEDKEVWIEVIDNGIGIPTEQLGEIYMYGFTTKRNNQGFGLHYCANAIREMSGSIKVNSEGRNTGTRVRLTLPVMEKGQKHKSS